MMLNKLGRMATSRIWLVSAGWLSITATAGAVDVGQAISVRLPELPDLTWHGVTLYGAIDLSAQYESHGAPAGSLAYSPQGIISPSNRNPKFLIASNQEYQSFVGLKTTQNLGYGFSLLAKGEIGFTPTTGQLANALGALQQQNGVPIAQQSSAYDGPRAGQVFNGDLYGGLHHEDYGTVTVGRQTTLSFDNIIVYDPLASYGFSLIGYVGVAAGQGGSEEVRTDSSVKYTYKNRFFHSGFFYANPNTGVKDIWQADVGFLYKGFSFDVAGGRANDEINAGSLAGAANLGSKFLGARVFDSDMFEVFGRYIYTLSPSSSVVLSGGYERIVFSNPADGGWSLGHSTIGGYELGPRLSTTGLVGGGIVNYGFTGGNRILNIYLLGLKYNYNERLSVAATYYRQNQNSFGFGVPGVAPAASAFYSKSRCSTKAFSNCAGSEDVIGSRVDYKYNKNINLYAGSTFSAVKNGLAFGFLNSSEVSVTAGVLFAF